jgi:hypothetical protein
MRLLVANVVTLFLSLSPVLAADGVPVLNVKPTCQGAEVAAVNPGQTLDTCLQKEEAARDQLRKSWANFPARDRTECSGAATIGPPSYVDLLTCLEMREDVRRPPIETTGSATNSGAASSCQQPTPASVQRARDPQIETTGSATNSGAASSCQRQPTPASVQRARDLK